MCEINYDDLLFFSIEWKLPELCELKNKMHLTMQPEGHLNFAFLKVSVTFIDKSLFTGLT